MAGCSDFSSVPISIHALREEGDLWYNLLSYQIKISIHALREEGDTCRIRGQTATAAFLSTPSARRATVVRLSIPCDVLFLSTPSARRATTVKIVFVASFQISIHALREEGDSIRHLLNCACQKFLSTPSARRATLTV